MATWLLLSRALLATWLLLTAGLLLASVQVQSQGMDGFESWEQAVAQASPSAAAVVADPPSDSRPVAAEVFEQAEAVADAEQAPGEYIIRFGVGATWLLPLRLDDKASGDRLMSDFSVSWAPFGLLGEIGADLAIGRQNTFVFRPNLKFFFIKHPWVSVYMEGACEVLSHADGTEVGGGAGLGLVIGILDNLALEIHASASLYSLSEAGAAQLLDLPDPTARADGSDLTVFPSVSARIMARF